MRTASVVRYTNFHKPSCAGGVLPRPTKSPRCKLRREYTQTQRGSIAVFALRGPNSCLPMFDFAQASRPRRALGPLRTGPSACPVIPVRSHGVTPAPLPLKVTPNFPAFNTDRMIAARSPANRVT